MSKQLAKRILKKSLIGITLLAALSEIDRAKTSEQIENILNRYTNSV